MARSVLYRMHHLRYCRLGLRTEVSSCIGSAVETPSFYFLFDPEPFGYGAPIMHTLSSGLSCLLPSPPRDDDTSWAASLTQCRLPRWLTTDKAREKKPHYTMVIALPLAFTIASLGLKYLTLFNKDCRLTLYSPPPTSTPPSQLARMMGLDQERWRDVM